mmetsp:Transcript_1077/g.3582  ORF Transcript_1077/g.3582 Transcript_1077/m.3582 type:complete len:338 (-) Transcript_1077:307-1320(-)
MKPFPRVLKQWDLLRRKAVMLQEERVNAPRPALVVVKENGLYRPRQLALPEETPHNNLIPPMLRLRKEHGAKLRGFPMGAATAMDLAATANISCKGTKDLRGGREHDALRLAIGEYRRVGGGDQRASEVVHGGVATRLAHGPRAAASPVLRTVHHMDEDSRLCDVVARPATEEARVDLIDDLLCRRRPRHGEGWCGRRRRLIHYKFRNKEPPASAKQPERDKTSAHAPGARNEEPADAWFLGDRTCALAPPLPKSVAHPHLERSEDYAVPALKNVHSDRPDDGPIWHLDREPSVPTLRRSASGGPAPVDALGGLGTLTIWLAQGSVEPKQRDEACER